VAQLWALPKDGSSGVSGRGARQRHGHVALADTSEKLFFDVSRLRGGASKRRRQKPATSVAATSSCGHCVKLW